MGPNDLRNWALVTVVIVSVWGTAMTACAIMACITSRRKTKPLVDNGITEATDTVKAAKVRLRELGDIAIRQRNSILAKDEELQRLKKELSIKMDSISIFEVQVKGFHDEIERLKEYIYESLPMVPLELKEKHGIYVHNWKIELKDKNETAVQNRDTQAS